ncbi:RNA polymerase sigma factor [Aquimarina sediminis]|uniref:RNA polymerase sigma factor n=1 Tax=Aquimarina sediminis TaxID=2070536 RepID=UPI000CA05B20|nr:sigma-70 family RNA polymerase sigma factor [Aquimarina sediminis]
MGLDHLIKRCKKKNAQAQEQLYRLYSSKLFSICLKYSNDYSSAEDTLQDAFITIFDKINQYKNQGSFEGWIKRITINTALQKYRKQKVFDIINEEQIEEIDVHIDEEEISLDYLLKIIQQLPDRYRLVFNLYVLDGYSHKEVSEMLEISVGTSKSNLARARKILKEKLENTQELYVRSIEERG